MRNLRSFLLRLSGLFYKARRERELADEIETHLQLHIQDNLRAGMTSAQALREARLKFGGIDAAKEAYRDRGSLPLLETFAQDLRYGARTLRKNPAFAVVAILTLALGIGANTAIYSVVRAVILRPLPARDPERLVRVYETNLSRGFATFSASIPNYSSWKGAVRSLEFGAYIRVARNWSADGEAQRLEGVAATASYLSVLGTDLRQGRWFEEPEEIPGQHLVTVLSDSFWKRQFGEDPAVIGRTLVLDGEPYQIIGIARSGFSIPVEPDVWVPLLAQPRAQDPNASRANHFLSVIGRLRPGFTLPQANAELVSMAGELERQFPATNTGWSASIVPLLHGMVPVEIRTALSVLLGAVGIVLLIACANVANLLLVRAEARRKEVAIRASLGAGAARISRQLLTESLLLSLTGGALGLALGWGLVQVARRALSEIIPRADQITIDAHVLLFALGISIVTGLLFGLAPLLQFGRKWSLEALHQASRTLQPAPRASLRSLLVIGQVSLATLLLVGAGLLIQSFARLQRVPTGMNADTVLTARISLPSQRYWAGAAYATLLSRLTDALRGAPGVRAAGISTAIPLGPGSHTAGNITAEPSAAQPLNCAWRSADGGFFTTLGIPLLRGRVFGAGDADGGRHVFVLSQAAARGVFGAEDPVGRQVRVNGTVGEVIGVVGDLRMRNRTDPPDRIVYFPLAQGGFFGVFTVFVRMQDHPEAAAALIRERLRELDPNVPAFDYRPMRDWVETNAAAARIRTWVLGLLAGVALTIGMIGIYGVLAYLVTLRRHEFGVRLALGARPGNLLQLVLSQGLSLAAGGVVLGLAAAMLFTTALSTLLFGVGARDPLTFAGVAVLLLLAAFIACYVPARRAARADPMVALRNE